MSTETVVKPDQPDRLRRRSFLRIATVLISLMLFAVGAALIAWKYECSVAMEYLAIDNRIFADFRKVEENILIHYNPSPNLWENHVDYNGLKQDAARFRQMQEELAKVKPPFILKEYHFTKLHFIDSYARTVEYMIAGDNKKALLALEETDKWEEKMLLEMVRFIKICGN